MEAPPPVAVCVENLRFSFGKREALRGVSLTVARGELFALLGPNGSGKTTLFRVLATLLAPQAGRALVAGFDTTGEKNEARRRLGVVFQHPSLDKKLTALENLMHHGHLYGMRGTALQEKGLAALASMGLAERAHDRVETLSGGMRRKVDLAKSFLHEPEILLLDEPTAGLDPGARRDFWQSLAAMRREKNITAVFTTHLMDEAERAGRVAVMNEGLVVALDSPEALKAEVGGDVVTVEAAHPEALREKIRARFGGDPSARDGAVRLERAEGHRFAAELVEAFPGEIRSVTVARPTLEDVFVRRTGRTFYEAEAAAKERAA